MKHWIARTILALGYTAIITILIINFWAYTYPIFIITISIFAVIVLWVIGIWSVILFGWAHKNCRKV